MHNGRYLHSLGHSCLTSERKIGRRPHSRVGVYVWPSAVTAVRSQLLLHKQIQCAAVNIDVGRLEPSQQQPSLAGSSAPTVAKLLARAQFDDNPGRKTLAQQAVARTVGVL